MPSTSPQPPSWADWLDAIAEQIKIANSAGTAAEHTTGEAIHLVRSSLKYARALLRLAPPSIRRRAKWHGKNLQKIARRLSRFRDRSVLRETIIGLSKDSQIQMPDDLAQEEQRALDDAIHRLEKMRSQFSFIPHPNENPDLLLRRLKRFKNKMQRREPHNWRTATIAELHAYRSALIVHACQVRFLCRVTGRPKKDYIEKIEKLRLRLGEINDLDRLILFSKQRRLQKRFNIDPSIVERANRRQQKIRKKLQQ